MPPLPHVTPQTDQNATISTQSAQPVEHGVVVSNEPPAHVAVRCVAGVVTVDVTLVKQPALVPHVVLLLTAHCR